MIDLRSDTCSQPTDDMRAAIAAAPVGDDVYGDDPSVLALEKEVASLLGKEDAVFVVSGSMANQIALQVHTRPGEAVILDGQSHIAEWESGGPARLSGLTLLRLASQEGLLEPQSIKEAIYRPHAHSPQRMHPVARLLCLENTNNAAGGVPWALGKLKAAADAGAQEGLALHLDGARLWNACAALDVSPADYAAAFDTVSVCFSKGLGAPVGSALAGSKEVIEHARWVKHALGGGVRQIGMMAAGAAFGLRHNRAGLANDHANAKLFAALLSQHEDIILDPSSVQTNIVRFGFKRADAYQVSEYCKACGLKILAGSQSAMRAVFHLNISEADTRSAAGKITDAIQVQLKV